MSSLPPQQLRDRNNWVGAEATAEERSRSPSHSWPQGPASLSHGSQKVLLVEATFKGFGTTYQMFCI